MPTMLSKTKLTAVVVYLTILTFASATFHGARHHLHPRDLGAALYGNHPIPTTLAVLPRGDSSCRRSTDSDSDSDSSSDDDDVTVSITNSLLNYSHHPKRSFADLQEKRSTTSRIVRTTTIIPSPASSVYHAAAYDVPGTQWIKNSAYQRGPSMKIAASLLQGGENGTYQPGIYNYPGYFNGSGVIPLDANSAKYFAPLKTIPSLNRDGGQGGMIGNVSLFWFADTTSFTTINATKNGSFTGMSANSVAIDVGQNALQGKAIALQDPIGMWANDWGFQRNWIPLTEAEATFNNANLPNGRRYAIWPTGGMIPFNKNSALLLPDITYVDIQSRFGTYQWSGNTLVNITIDAGQPTAHRIVPRLFVGGQPQYGSLGGYRSWGPSGTGGNDGKVYLFGNGRNGMFVTRSDVSSVTDYSSYEYWHRDTTSPDGGFWSTTIANTTTDAFIKNPFGVGYSSGNIIFSPYHGTFIFIFQTNAAFNKFYYSYLQVPKPLKPRYHTTSYVDIAEALVKYSWSAPKDLLSTPTPHWFTYDGGVHLGYFGADDITRGGTKMLLSWTLPQKAPSNVLGGGYNTMTAELDWA